MRRAQNAQTVTGVSAGQTLTASVNSKTASYVALSTDASNIPAFVANAIAYFQQSTIPEISELTWDNPDTGVVRATGLTTGRPLSLTFGGTVTSAGTSGYPITATSPSDFGDAANYVGATQPGNGDTLIIENLSVPILWNLAEYTSNTVTIVRRGSHTGQFGLPDTAAGGYPEYLPTHVETAGTSMTIEDNGATSFVRVLSTAGSAVTAYVLAAPGGGAGQLNREGVEITGLPASSVVNLTGASLAFAPLVGQTSVAATLRASNGSIRFGQGATIGAGNLADVQAEIACGWTTLSIDGASSVTATRAAAAATSTTVEGGTLFWNSTGGWGALLIGSGATVDVKPAPATVTSGTITMEEGATLDDTYERIAKTYNLVLNGQVENMTLLLGTRVNLAVS